VKLPERWGCWRLGCPFQRPPDVPELVVAAGLGVQRAALFPLAERRGGTRRLAVPTLPRSDFMSTAWVGAAEITVKYQR